MKLKICEVVTWNRENDYGKLELSGRPYGVFRGLRGSGRSCLTRPKD
jgi:hypothetical protein